MRILSEDILTVDGSRATVSLATSANLQPIFIGSTVNYGIQIAFTGTPAGSFKLQVSADPANGAKMPIQSSQYSGISNWTDVAGSSSTVSAAGDIFWNYANTGAMWVRVVWAASGAGTTPVLTSARVVTKGV